MWGITFRHSWRESYAHHCRGRIHPMVSLLTCSWKDGALPIQEADPGSREFQGDDDRQVQRTAQLQWKEQR